MITHNGIESLTNPEPERRPEPKPRPRCEATAYFGERLHCQKDDGHDDPMAEVGSRRTDPFHQVVYRVNATNKLTITYTWETP